MVGGRLDEKKIGAHVSDADRIAIDDQTHLYLGGVRAVTLFRGHERNPDFAGAYLDARPEFPADVWADWEAEKREQFDKRWPMVQRILEAFENIGIYLLDVSAGNIAFRD